MNLCLSSFENSKVIIGRREHSRTHTHENIFEFMTRHQSKLIRTSSLCIEQLVDHSFANDQGEQLSVGSIKRKRNSSRHSTECASLSGHVRQCYWLLSALLSSTVNSEQSSRAQLEVSGSCARSHTAVSIHLSFSINLVWPATHCRLFELVTRICDTILGRTTMATAIWDTDTPTATMDTITTISQA